jgi:hypothetical protein
MNKNFVRLNELASLTRDDPNSYFHESLDNLHEEEQPKKFLLSIENELSELDTESWCFLKKEAESLCVISDADKRRGWTKLFEKLNEAKGYGFFKSKGYSEISFIPRSKRQGVETPDLKGERDASIALCEVKTINSSDYLINAIDNNEVFRSGDTLPEGLTRKLKSTFDKAASQLNSCTQYSNPEKYIYLIIKYDAYPHFRNELNAQTREYFNTLNLVGVNLVIHDEE